MACTPDQSPEAVHKSVFVEDQVSVLLPPEATETGLADNESVAGGDTATFTACEMAPLAPVHDSA